MARGRCKNARRVFYIAAVVDARCTWLDALILGLSKIHTLRSSLDNPRIVQEILGLRVQRSNPRFVQTILGLSEFEVCT